MTDRDRLIELIKQAEKCPPEYDGEERDTSSVFHCEGCQYAETTDCVAERIADYLLANGVIVPPCKVGDIVYLFYPVRKGIYEAVVDEICLTEKSNFIVTRDLYFNRRQSIFIEQIGKTVFLTKEEAVFLTKEEAEEKLREIKE